jgi:chromosome segregation protein
MEESGITKLISIRLEQEDETRTKRESLPEENFVEEEVEPEEGRELPLGVDDPAQISEADLRPIRSGKKE